MNKKKGQWMKNSQQESHLITRKEYLVDEYKKTKNVKTKSLLQQILKFLLG